MATVTEVAADINRIIVEIIRALREHAVTGVTAWSPMREARY